MAKKTTETIFDEAREAGERARLAFLRPKIEEALAGVTHDAAMARAGLDAKNGAHRRAWFRAVEACGLGGRRG